MIRELFEKKNLINACGERNLGKTDSLVDGLKMERLGQRKKGLQGRPKATAKAIQKGS